MTNAEIQKKKEIQSALAQIPAGDFLETAKDLLAVLGYRSERTDNCGKPSMNLLRNCPPGTKTPTQKVNSALKSNR